MRAVRTFAKRKICCVAGNSFFSSGAAAFGAGFAVCRKSVVWFARSDFVASGGAVNAKRVVGRSVVRFGSERVVGCVAGAGVAA